MKNIIKFTVRSKGKINFKIALNFNANQIISNKKKEI